MALAVMGNVCWKRKLQPLCKTPAIVPCVLNIDANLAQERAEEVRACGERCRMDGRNGQAAKEARRHCCGDLKSGNERRSKRTKWGVLFLPSLPGNSGRKSI